MKPRAGDTSRKWRSYLRHVLEIKELSLAPQVGLEPTTLRLTAECSTIELLRSNRCALFHLNRRPKPCQIISLSRSWGAAHQSETASVRHRVNNIVHAHADRLVREFRWI